MSRILMAAKEEFKTVPQPLTEVGVVKITPVKSSAEATEMLKQQGFDFVVISSPLDNETGTTLAKEAQKCPLAGVLLFYKDIAEKDRNELEGQGVWVIEKPLSVFDIVSFVRLSNAILAKQESLAQENRLLKKKLDELATFSRAKLILISSFSMDEGDAHRYIEKKAMDLRLSRLDIAKTIIATYGKSKK